MTKAERETKRRAKETSNERQARQEKVVTQMAQTRASETFDERQARQEKDVNERPKGEPTRLPTRDRLGKRKLQSKWLKPEQK